MNAVLFDKGRIGLAVTLAAGLCVSVGRAAPESPYATGGEVTKVDLGNFRVRYFHIFTNTDEVATFRNIGKKALSLRYLVVGGGGSGGYGSAKSGGKYSAGGGGGGGGGVCEEKDVPFAAGAEWSVLVGKGAEAVVSRANPGTAATASTISNATAKIAEAPGGGNGARAGSNVFVDATAGAAGGGSATYANDPGAGTYASSVFGIVPAGAPFAGGGKGSAAYSGGGGGGAGAAGTVPVAWTSTTGKAGNGGEGLFSDITGESLAYGSGGGGGGGTTNLRIGGVGGSRAGNGATYEISGATTNFYPATAPVANSGCGGAGGLQDGNCDAATDGADGVVIIRYEVVESPCAGGDVIMRTELRPGKYRYLHFFTNTLAAALFSNCSGRDLSLRYLVVGGGGSGGYGSVKNGGSYSSGGGGGGGGGVYEEKDVPFAAGAEWSVLVGKGAEAVVSRANPGTAATASTISNATAKIAEAPGGGNGARAGSNVFVDATAGAAGGGSATYASTSGGAGNYASSVFGIIPAGAPFAGGGNGSAAYCGGGGGGAGAAGTAPVAWTSTTGKAGNGGEGLFSDITGESLAYGSGGGGGGGTYRLRIGGVGGSRAGNGATYEISGATTNFYPATAPVANSGCGGAGGLQNGNCDAATDGADGVVIIRYDYVEVQKGLILIVR